MFEFDHITEKICTEWRNERNKHPFYAEELSGEAIEKCWNESAVYYSGDEHAALRSEIYRDLLETNVLDKNRTMLDIGCGPGLYEKIFSPHLKHIFCIDGSEGMLDRLNQECIQNNIGNVSCEVCMWEEFDTSEKYDLVFTSLCPPTNNPESLLRMERYSSDLCIYISSANPTPNLSTEIWSRLGKGYSFKGYDTNYPYLYLSSVGRQPCLKFYTQVYDYEMDASEMIELQERSIGRYLEITPDVSNVIRSVVGSYSRDGIFRESKIIRLGLLAWRSI